MYVPRASRRLNWKLATSVLGFIFKVADDYTTSTHRLSVERKSKRDGRSGARARGERRRGRNTRRERKKRKKERDFAADEAKTFREKCASTADLFWRYSKKKYRPRVGSRAARFNRGQRRIPIRRVSTDSGHAEERSREFWSFGGKSKASVYDKGHWVADFGRRVAFSSDEERWEIRAIKDPQTSRMVNRGPPTRRVAPELSQPCQPTTRPCPNVYGSASREKI